MKNIIIGVALLTGISALMISVYNIDKKKQVFIDMGKVYSEFKLSKELNVQLEKVLKVKKTITDSLYEDVKRKTQELRQQPKQTLEEMAKVAKMEEALYYKQQEFEKENQLISSEYSNKVWTQLNQFVSEYGSENKYVFILGANGQGNIMYADKNFNITDDVIQYVNNKYDGKIK